MPTRKLEEDRCEHSYDPATLHDLAYTIKGLPFLDLLDVSRGIVARLAKSRQLDATTIATAIAEWAATTVTKQVRDESRRAEAAKSSD